MIFTSAQYLIFLSLVVFLYYILPHKFRWVMLLAASFYFYACWSIRMLPWLVFVILLSYTAGLLIAPESSQTSLDRSRRRWGIFFGTTSLIIVLFVFKYLNFMIDQIENTGGILGINISLPRTDWITPVGVSFFTFQALGYVFDVYHGKINAATHLGKFALFIAFFPHLAEGPIDRSDNLLPQIDEEHRFNYESTRRALVLVFFGIFKKVVIADRLAILVDTVFDSVSSYSGISCWIAAVFYSFQIYCDFLGYTEIALGSAALMGFRLAPNFNTPYLSTSIADFWRRWHISLSRWFRDYIYIPLGGSRVSSFRWALNVIVVFLVSGIWHGAAWTFILWGVLHGLFQIIGKFKGHLTKKMIWKENPFINFLRILTTFTLVTFLWILFRSASIQDYVIFLRNMFSFAPGFGWLSLGMSLNELVLSFLLIALMIMFDILQSRFDLIDGVESLALPIRWLLYLVFLFAIIMFGRYGSLTADSFIYFQF